MEFCRFASCSLIALLYFTGCDKSEEFTSASVRMADKPEKLDNTPQVTAAELFIDCHPKSQLPGTSQRQVCRKWDAHITYLEKQLNALCVDAGEKIYHPVEDVKGVYIAKPTERLSSFYFHSKFEPDSMVHPYYHRHYRAVESHHRVQDPEINHFSITDIKPGRRRAHVSRSSHYPTSPTLDYEVRFKHLTDQEQRLHGLYGEKTVVIERESGKLLGERLVYFYVIKANLQTSMGENLRIPGKTQQRFSHVQTCRNYAPKISLWDKEYSRDPYGFLIKVLKPEAPSEYESKILYEITRGIGEVKNRCAGMKVVGYGIGPEDLKLERKERFLKLDGLPPEYADKMRDKKIGDDLIITLKETGDRFICDNHFWGPSSELNLLFNNGELWKQKQIFDYYNIEDEDK